MHEWYDLYRKPSYKTNTRLKKETISELLGYKKVFTTYDLYIHLLEPNVKMLSRKVLDGGVSLRMDVHFQVRKGREAGKLVAMK